MTTVFALDGGLTSSEVYCVREGGKCRSYQVSLEVNGTRVMATLDTGAEHTVLPEAVYRRMVHGRARQYEQPVLIESVNNDTVEGYLVTLDSVRIGPFEFIDVPALIMKCDGACVVGRSALRRLRITIENGCAQLTLRCSPGDVLD